MNEPTKSIDYQIIEQDGQPAFAVVPYDEFRQLIALYELDSTVTIPNEVVKKHSIEGLSILRAWREYLNLTQEDMATRLNVSQGSVAQHEKVSSKPQHSTLIKWADALGIDIEQLRV